MARQQKKFVEKLDAFTESLSEIVEVLKEDVERRKEDATGKLTESLKDNIIQIAEDIRVIREDISSIKTDTSSIKQTVEQLKTEKEKGMVGEIGTDKTDSIVKGVATIVLIAGAVWAIGTAFKLVGEVDYKSVISLSISMYAIAKSFEAVANIENLTIGKALLASSAIVIFSGAIWLSSRILSGVEEIGLGKLFTTIMLAGVVVVLMYALKPLTEMDLKEENSKKAWLLTGIIPALSLSIMFSSWILRGVKPLGLAQLFTTIMLAGVVVVLMYALKPLTEMDLKEENSKKAWLLTGIIPALALGITLSSWILYFVVPLGLGKLFTVLLLSIVVVVMMYALKPLINMDLQEKDVAKALLMPIIIPAIAAAIAFSSKILSEHYEPVGNLWNMLLFSIVAAVAVLAFSVSVRILGKMDIKSLGIGVLGTVLVSVAIAASSWIITLGNYDKNYPSFQWAAGVGLSILTFSLAALAVGAAIMLTGGLGFAALATGAAAILLVAGSISLTSHIIASGDYSNNYPSLDWAKGAGSVMVAFGGSALLVGAMILSTLGVGAVALVAGLGSIVLVAGTMVLVSRILNAGNYGKYPSLDWAQGVGSILSSFVKNIEGVRDYRPVRDGVNLLALSKTLLEMDENFSKGNFSKYPSSDWSSGFVKFGNAINTMNISKIVEFFDTISKLGKNDDITEGINKMSSSFDRLARSLDRFGSSAGTNLKHLNDTAISLSVLSAIDAERVSNMLETVNQRTGVLRRIAYESNAIIGFLEDLISTKKEDDQTKSVTEIVSGKSAEGSGESEMLNYIKNIDNNLKNLFDLKKQEFEILVERKEEDEESGKNVEDKNRGWFGR